MLNNSSNPSPAVTRRQFIKTSSLVAASAAAAVSFPAVVRAAGKQPINAVIIGIGGRGGGAGGNFLEAVKNLGVDGKIVAVADLFPEQAQRGKDNFSVPDEKCFSGFDAFRKALEVPGVNYCILATPPGFRASHFRACVEAGKNVFMEKPVAVDGTGCRLMYETAEMAKQKNLKVAAGTQRRHQAGYLETIKRIHDGEIGDVVTLRAYWVNGGPIWHRGDHGDTDLERQIRNWYHYIWLSGDHICEQHVHNLDVCNWIMQDHPVRCWGQGARQQLGDKSGEIWDNFAIEYEYKNGVRLFSYCGQIKRDWSSVSEAVHGTKGTSDPGNSIRPHSGQMWRFREKSIDPYVQEHMDLINAIHNDGNLNEAKQVTDSTLTAIMGREAAYSGAGVEWDDILNCKFAYAPEQLYQDCANMKFGEFRTLQPPMPSMHNILKDPPVVPAKA
ncbi:MAG TPA: Gfo/Idh/MocA family oxidoreductase [Verrucomicrobiae bacterium]|nr:Gfo/Idh/MocA family oxidoreductase [Verrucomicrobiae bacterium]